MRTGTWHSNIWLQVYNFAQSLLLPASCSPSLSSMAPNKPLDTLPKNKTLRQLGFLPSATIMVVPGPEHPDQARNWMDSMLSPRVVILVIILACLLGLLYLSPTDLENPKISLSTAKELTGRVWNIGVRLLLSVGHFIKGLGGFYCICCYILVFCALSSMYVGLPYGRLVWVGGYDHNWRINEDNQEIFKAQNNPTPHSVKQSWVDMIIGL